MKSRFTVLSLALIALVVTASLNAADKKEAKKDPLKGIKCAVNSKKDIVKTNFVAYKDAKVYFCCKGCPKAFAKDSKKFATKANHQLVATGQFKLAVCPISGRKIDAKQVVKVAGVKVAFCCKNCKGKVAKAKGDEQLALVFAEKAFEKSKAKKVEKKKKAEKKA